MKDVFKVATVCVAFMLAYFATFSAVYGQNALSDQTALGEAPASGDLFLITTPATMIMITRIGTASLLDIMRHHDLRL